MTISTSVDRKDSRNTGLQETMLRRSAMDTILRWYPNVGMVIKGLEAEGSLAIDLEDSTRTILQKGFAKVLEIEERGSKVFQHGYLNSIVNQDFWGTNTFDSRSAGKRGRAKWLLNMEYLKAAANYLEESTPKNNSGNIIGFGSVASMLAQNLEMHLRYAIANNMPKQRKELASSLAVVEEIKASVWERPATWVCGCESCGGDASKFSVAYYLTIRAGIVRVIGSDGKEEELRFIVHNTLGKLYDLADRAKVRSQWQLSAYIRYLAIPQVDQTMQRLWEQIKDDRLVCFTWENLLGSEYHRLFSDLHLHPLGGPGSDRYKGMFEDIERSLREQLRKD